MSNYKRARLEGGTYFFTVVTYNRMPFLTTPLARRCLSKAFALTKKRYPFKLDAICLLPNHLHCIWTLPESDTDFSKRWSFLKTAFSRLYLNSGGVQGTKNASRKARHEAAIWQRRFWEHLIRDEKDFYRHLDYIHYNPVKHDFAKSPAEWKWSTFSRYVKANVYPENWGEAPPDTIAGWKMAVE
jgi:putative transposase